MGKAIYRGVCNRTYCKRIMQFKFTVENAINVE